MEALYSIEQEGLIHYDKENIHPNVIIALDPYLKDKEFDPEFIRCQSSKTICLRQCLFSIFDTCLLFWSGVCFGTSF